jgi:hypothetical protein
MPISGIRLRVVLARLNVSDKLMASITNEERIGELVTRVAVTSN